MTTVAELVLDAAARGLTVCSLRGLPGHHRLTADELRAAEAAWRVEATWHVVPGADGRRVLVSVPYKEPPVEVDP